MEIIGQKIAQTLEENYMPYAMSVIISRAIPEIDGFKPSHRKLLYTMYKMGLLGATRTKSANVVGQTMKLNPHGDGAIYETLVRLTRGNEALLHPLVDSKGNFGKQYSRDMAYAASRYTEVRLEPICKEIFTNIDKETVEFMDNYDGTMKEPVMLPVAFPTILVNPNQGIAVGMASSICSFNLREVCDATIAYLKNESMEVTDYITAPDFSTGGEILYDKKEMAEILRSGRGSFKVRAKYTYDKKNSCIEIYEIPYTTTSEAIMDKIIDCVKTGKTREINDVRDETDLKGLKITIDIKKNADVENLMAKLFKSTPLEDSFGCNFNILIHGSPMVLGVKEIIRHWCEFRIGCIQGNLRYDIREKGERLHLLLGLSKILLDIDKAVQLIRNTQKESDVVPNLMKGFDIDQVQAEYVAEIKLRNLNREYLLKRTGEIDTLKEELERLKFVLDNEKEVKKMIISELRAISKKYGQDRKTSLVSKEEVVQVKEENFVEDYRLRLFLTRDNYLKKISLASLRGSSEQKLKQGDEIIQEFEASNKEDLLLFSNQGEVYKCKIYELTDCKASVLGEYLPNDLNLAEGEKIVYMVATSDYSGDMLFAFENGKLAKVDMKGYETKTNRKKLTGAYSMKSPLRGILHLPQDTQIYITSRGGRGLVIHTALVTQKSKRDTQGIQVYLSKRDPYIDKMQLAEEIENLDLSRYESKKIPSSGQKITLQDQGFTQITMLEE